MKFKLKFPTFSRPKVNKAILLGKKGVDSSKGFLSAFRTTGSFLFQLIILPLSLFFWLVENWFITLIILGFIYNAEVASYFKGFTPEQAQEIVQTIDSKIKELGVPHENKD